MGRVSGACKFLGMIFILSLLIQGSYAAEESNQANTNSNYTINDTVNGTIIGTINGTINDPINGTAIGTINGTVNGTISSTISKIDPFQWVLILPILVGYLLFLCWLCRFFDKMNFCLVFFVLIALTLAIFSFDPSSWVIRHAPLGLMSLFIILAIAVILYETNETIFKIKWFQDKLQGNLIMSLHDIVRNFIVISAVLIWPLILLYLYKHNIESVTFYGIEGVEFPVIIAASSIGVLSYLLLSIEEIFGQLIPEYKKMSIAWSYIRRILIAPFIALIVVYILPFSKPDGTTLTDEISVFFFSFIAGFFTKAVEEWVYVGVQKILPDAFEEEFKSRTEKYDVEKSDFIIKLRLPKDLAYMLYNAKIRTIEELAGYNAEEIIKKVDLDTRNLGEIMECPVKKRKQPLGNYEQKQLEPYTKRAKYYTEMDEKNDLVKYLKMDRDLAFKLYLRADIKDFYDLKKCDPKYVHKNICDYKTESQEAHDRLCECSEEIIQNFKEKAKVELEQDINPVAVFLACPISGKHPLEFKFTDKSTGNPTAWDWDFGDNTSHSTEKNPEHTYSLKDTYTIVLEVKNPKGSSTLKKDIEVK